MVSFSTFVRSDGAPIYTQIVQFIQRGIAAGTILSGDELPSRRVLSALLGVNPNTIQKAYRILEDEGLIQSHSGAKSCVSASPEQREKIREQLLCDDVRKLIQALRQSGVEKAEAAALVERLWDES
ncbi:MAG: GntR family transcriptional regulator [Oscillospiraceae bacterium]|nr:GntR family transcriptional regulator [Oscillospiraceae bacterium]